MSGITPAKFDWPGSILYAAIEGYIAGIKNVNNKFL